MTKPLAFVAACAVFAVTPSLACSGQEDERPFLKAYRTDNFEVGKAVEEMFPGRIINSKHCYSIHVKATSETHRRIAEVISLDNLQRTAEGRTYPWPLLRLARAVTKSQPETKPKMTIEETRNWYRNFERKLPMHSKRCTWTTSVVSTAMRANTVVLTTRLPNRKSRFQRPQLVLPIVLDAKAAARLNPPFDIRIEGFVRRPSSPTGLPKGKTVLTWSHSRLVSGVGGVPKSESFILGGDYCVRIGDSWYRGK